MAAFPPSCARGSQLNRITDPSQIEHRESALARIRSIKPELRTSLTAADWPRDVRYLFVLLWGYLDDYGRGVDEPRLIKADCFPLDDDVTAVTVESWLAIIARCGSLCRYEVEGRRYLHCPAWAKHQKPSHPTDSRIPPCPSHEPLAAALDDSRSDSGDAPEDFVPEQLVVDGAVSSKKNSSSTADAADAQPPRPRRKGATPPGFDAFWTAYPRKVAKAAAEKAWTRAITAGASPALVTEAARFYAMERKLQDPQFTKHPATWLNAGCWQDEPDPAYKPAAIAGPSEATRGSHHRPVAEVLAAQAAHGNGTITRAADMPWPDLDLGLIPDD